MKKFLRNLLLVSTAILMASNISAQAALYAVGGSSALGQWDPSNPAEFTYENGVYTLNLDESSSSFKISTTKGTWDQFNAGNLTPNAAITNGGTVKLSVNKDGGDITLPWAGTWTITVNLTAMTLKAETTTDEPVFTSLFMTGNDGTWNPSNPIEIPFDDAKGAFYRKGVVFVDQNYEMGGSNHYGAICKISRAKGTWDQFNAAGICSANDATVAIGTPGTLYLQACQNIPVEKSGTYDITVDLENKTILLEGSSAATTLPEVLFLCGNLADTDGAWEPSYDGAILDPTDEEGEYFISKVELVGADGGESAYFSFNTNVGSWEDVNKYERYGAESADMAVTIGQSMAVVNGGTNPNAWKIEPGVYSITVNLKNMTILVDATTGIESIEAENNAPAVYYNLQGIKVANPENGIYIVKQGNKVTKVVK